MKHWSEIRLLDPETIRAEQAKETRNRIVGARLDRRLVESITPFARVGRHAFRALAERYKRIEDRLIRLAGLQDVIRTPLVNHSTEGILREAKAMSRDQKWSEAERLYLEVLKHDERNADAYRGLGYLYLAMRQLKQAKETFHFLVRTNGADDTVYAGLAEIAESEGDLSYAEAMRRKAVAGAPNHPKRHAELARYYIKYGSSELAWNHAREATDLDPSSPRFLEISVEAAILVADRAEAEDRLNRLRMLSNDRSRLQSLRERIDAMPS